MSHTFCHRAIKPPLNHQTINYEAINYQTINHQTSSQSTKPPPRAVCSGEVTVEVKLGLVERYTNDWELYPSNEGCTCTLTPTILPDPG